MKNTPLLWLLKNIKKRIPALLIMTAAQVGHALFGVWFALGTRNVINTAVGGTKAEFLHACFFQAGIILGLLLCLVLFRHLRGKLDADMDRDWKRMLLHRLLRGEYGEVSAYHSGELLNRLNNDVRAVNEGLLHVIPTFASTVSRLLGALTVLVVLEPIFALLLLAAGVVILVVTGLLRQRLKTIHKEISHAEGRVSSMLQETLEKLLLVQAMDLGDEMERRTDGLLDIRYRAQRKRNEISVAYSASLNLMYHVAGLGALAWCAAGLLQGTMLFGDLTAVTQLVNQIQAPFANLSGVLPKYAAMLASAERLMELDSLQCGQRKEKMLPRSVYEEMEAICAEKLNFSYDRDTVLRDLSFRLEKGSFAVVTAPSGKGKSTLLKLMLGIFKPDSGELALELDSGRIPLSRDTRRLFAYVPQGNLIFSGTLRENLLVVDPEADDAAIARATYVSAMDDYLPQLPQGLDTLLGESGAGLSEGQSQRLAIARAVLGGAPILLLDEATSALDEDTEKRVLERIRTLPGRTCIAVTHRPAAKDMADAQLDIA